MMLSSLVLWRHLGGLGLSGEEVMGLWEWSERLEALRIFYNSCSDFCSGGNNMDILNLEFLPNLWKSNENASSSV